MPIMSYVVYFVSGHRNVTEEEFKEHYVPKLNKGINEGAVFVMGDYYGVDQMAQKFLVSKNYPWSRIRVYHMLESPRCCEKECEFTIGGFKSDEERDDAMTFASTDDIAWVRPGKESSGTAQNLARRQRDAIMVGIAEANNNFNTNAGHSKKFQGFFDKMHDHLKTEWEKLSGEFVEENEGE
jgi:hypothetical protein